MWMRERGRSIRSLPRLALLTSAQAALVSATDLLHKPLHSYDSTLSSADKSRQTPMGSVPLAPSKDVALFRLGDKVGKSFASLSATPETYTLRPSRATRLAARETVAPSQLCNARLEALAFSRPRFCGRRRAITRSGASARWSGGNGCYNLCHCKATFFSQEWIRCPERFPRAPVRGLACRVRRQILPGSPRRRVCLCDCRNRGRLGRLPREGGRRLALQR